MLEFITANCGASECSSALSGGLVYVCVCGGGNEGAGGMVVGGTFLNRAKTQEI